MKSGSNLEKVLRSGQFAFTGELGPPRGSNVEAVREKAAPLKGMVDSVNITDNQTAMVRMSSWAASIIAIEEGLEPNYQMVCRDRNRRLPGAPASRRAAAVGKKEKKVKKK